MGLKVYKGKEASRDYENSFFRDFSSNLVELFKKEHLDGILIGHPKVPENTLLMPGCVLITENRLVLIDFKKHSGSLWLPDESSFENAPWKHGSVEVGGGSANNPFAQLKKQKERTEAIIGKNTYGQFGIACVVCFQEDMNIMNDVPSRHQAWFSVTNRSQYINRIFDIINVKSNQNVDIEEIFSHFEAEPYHNYYPINIDEVITVSEANKRSVEADRRVYQAERKVEVLTEELQQKNISEESEKKLKLDLEKARKERDRYKNLAKIEREKFNKARGDLDIAIENAKAKQAEADKAKYEAVKSKYEAEKDAEKLRVKERMAELEAETLAKSNKRKTIAWIVCGIVCLVALITSVIVFNIKNENDKQLAAEEKAKLEEDYRNGVKCITPDMASNYVGNNVCVEYYIGYVNSNKYYVYRDENKSGSFQVIIPNSAKILTVNEAKDKYLHKKVTVRGTLEQYKDAYEIKVTKLEQISFN